MRLDYGMEDKNPIDKVRFYMKQSPRKPISVSRDQVNICAIRVTRVWLLSAMYSF